MQKYEVWSEGYRMNCEEGHACLEGTYEANSFQEACDIMAHDKGYDKSGLYNKEHRSVWGCRLFDNEEDARKSFG